MIYFSVLFNYCFFPSLLFCSFLFLLYACARQTRYQELAVALDSSNLTNKQLVTKIEELVRNNPANQFDIVFAAPPRSLGVCKVTGSLIVPQGRLLTQHFIWNKMGCMENLWEDQSLRPLVSVVAHPRKQKQSFVASIYVCSLDLLTLSLDDKHPHKTAISGPGLNPWNREFWCWQQCENLFRQVVMLF